MACKNMLICWITGIFAISVSGTVITVCPSQIPGTPCQVICESIDLSQPVTFLNSGGSVAFCLAGGSCYSTTTGYDQPYRRGTNQTVLNIPSFDRTRDPGEWTCSAGVSVSSPVTMHYAIPPISATIIPTNFTVNSSTMIIVTTECAYINISGIIQFKDRIYSQRKNCAEVPLGGCAIGTGEKYTCTFILNPGDMGTGTYELEFRVDLPYDNTNPIVNLTSPVYLTFPESQQYCQVSDIKSRNLAKGKTDMSTDDTSCKTVCPVTVAVTEIVLLIVTAIVVHLIYEQICSNFRCFVYVCVALHISTVIIAVIISGGIVGKLRVDGSSGCCCEEYVVVLSAVIPVLIVTICVIIVAVLLIMKFGKDNIRIKPKTTETNGHDHAKKTSIRTCCAKFTCKVTSEKLCKSDEHPPGATELPTPTSVSPTSIIVTAAGSSGRKKLPPIGKKEALENNIKNQNNQPTEPPKPSIVQTSDEIKELKPKSKKIKSSKNISQQQPQSASENMFHGKLEKTTNSQTNNNSVYLNKTINKHTFDGDVSQDEREKRKNEQKTNEKREHSSQKTESDMKSNDNNNSQTNLKTNEMTDNVGQTSHHQQQKTDTESKAHEKHKPSTSQIQHDKITDNSFENQEDSKHISSDGRKNNQIKQGQKAKPILQNDDSLKVAEINSANDEMANTPGTTAHEQRYPASGKMLHEKQDKAIKNQPNIENMPEKTNDALPSDQSNSKHSSTGGENGKGEVQSEQ